MISSRHAYCRCLTFAAIEGEASTVGVATGDGAVSGGFLPPGASFNFPVAIQTSITAGLRYEVNDSAALKIEYQVVDVDTDQQTLDSCKPTRCARPTS